MTDCSFSNTPSELQDHSCCGRLLLWPCQSSVALSNACVNCDCMGIFKVLFCCPCRTCCGICPTSDEQQLLDEEPEEIPYTQIFEIERKKRQMIMMSSRDTSKKNNTAAVSS